MSQTRILIIGLVVITAYLFFDQRPTPPVPSTSPRPRPAKVTPAPLPQALNPPPQADQVIAKPIARTESAEPPAPPPKSLPFRIIQGWVVANGDILIGKPNDPQGFPLEGFIEAPPLKLWENRTIPFSIDSKLSNPERILRVIEYFNTHTNVRFTPHAGEADGIVFTPIEGHCLSYLGRVGGAQPVLLDDRCDDQEIIHELMHVLGFVHEHSRPDREQFVAVNWPNIEEEKKDQFLVVPHELIEPLKDRPFDYQSVMIYPDRAFAKDRSQPTLSSKTGQKIEPPRNGLSSEDLERIRILYR